MIRSPWLGLVALCAPMLIVSMDVSVLFFAVPYISEDLAPSPEQQLWIFDVYGFVLAGLLLSMGALADRFGHRRVLLLGATAFGIASVIAAYATSAEMLIGARAVLAVAGATLMPSTLALIRRLFDDEGDRTKAVAAWNAVMTGGVAVGPIISGVLLEQFWWGSVFLINVPVMVVLLVVAPILLPADTGDRSRRVDLLSSLFVLASLLPIIQGIKTLAAHGFSVERTALIVIGLSFGAAFVARQRRLEHPLVDLQLFANRRLSASIWINVVSMFGLMGNAVMMTQYLQSVLGYSPLQAALWSLAPSVVVGAVAPTSAVLAARVGRPPVMVGGLLVGACGYFVLAAATGTDTLVTVLIGATLLAGGIVSTTTMVADHVVSVAPADRAGASAALLETSSELGGALGIALLGSLLNLIYRRTVDQGVVTGAAARESLAGAIADRGSAADVIDAARSAFVSGLSGAALVAGLVLVLTAIGAMWALRGDTAPAMMDRWASSTSSGTARREHRHTEPEPGLRHKGD
ncbi:MFS transporter [Williamsia sterculiae]|uniref:MFS transporter, DHA2 family, multidrug resistance protein n=1 Tax=Williamsia sterculiae TaxID=1344003 RepID=A0A1N7HDJ6_9NOCA|nr:MFS transporter [Williamsia sterculiae]SIS22758.1 MFS transporter, DHA2 family, multidrug resistance protein [Williamsia sterculiae]